MASEFCYSIELQEAIARHDAKQARVLPIVLRPTDWEGAPFAKLQALPSEARPVSRGPAVMPLLKMLLQASDEPSRT